MASPGYYRNPADKWCWEYCTSCGRCSNKGRYAACNGCSGRFDAKGIRDPDIDDYCRCKEGILQWKTQEGRLVQVRFTKNPFSSIIAHEKASQDEADWESYLKDTREKLGDEHWDPIQFDDGSSTTDWARSQKYG